MNQSNQEPKYTPRVSIGMPVYNGEQHIRETIESLLAQTFSDFELIISDNASTDRTKAVCREYVSKDPRVNYLQQSNNIGATANFRFVLNEARGEYFMWTGCDDTHSSNFIEDNLKFLMENPEYVASTCPNGFDDHELEDQKLEDFALDGNFFERVIQFFEYCWVSNGIFYSLVRTDILRGCEIIGHSFLAADWVVILYLASKGKIHRTTDGYAIFGANGVSRSADAFRAFRNNSIELLFPLYRLSWYTYSLIRSLTFKQRLKILFVLIKLNLSAFIIQLRLWLSQKFHKKNT